MALKINLHERINVINGLDDILVKPMNIRNFINCPIRSSIGQG